MDCFPREGNDMQHVPTVLTFGSVAFGSDAALGLF